MGAGDEQNQTSNPTGDSGPGAADPAVVAALGASASSGAAPKEFGNRLISVTESIQRELEQLRQVSSDQERRESSLTEREAKLESRERKLADAVESLRSAKADIEQQRQSLSSREAEVSALAEQTSARQSEVQSREASIASREESLKAQESELSALRQTVEAAQRAHEQSERELASGVERLAAQKKVLRDREATVGEREATCDSREAEIAALEKSVTSATESGRHIAELEAKLRKNEASHAQAIAALRAELEQANARADEAEQQHKAVAEQLAAVDSDQPSAAHEAEIARRDEALERVTARLRDAVAHAESLEAQLAESGGHTGDPSAAPVNDEFCALRRERLRRLKSMLEERAKKVIRAREAIAKKAAELEKARQEGAPVADDSQREQLQSRLAEAEKVLTMRAALSERHATLEKQARMLQRKSAKSPAGALMAAFAVMMGASAFGGWQLASQFADATYLVQATVAMESNGDATSAEQVQGWTTFHESLAKDPQLMEKVAERMRRRGYTELGSATSVTARMRNDLEVQPGARGELVFTLRGEGQARTEGVLDAFVGTLVQMGNDARDRRRDGAAAIIKTGAKADSRPVGDPRLSLFGMIAGGLAALSMCVWFVAWRGLCKRSLIPPEDTIDVV